MNSKQKTWQKIKADPSLVARYLVREQVIDSIRTYFKTNGFHEVDTPLIVRYPGTEPFLEVFETQLRLADGRKSPGYLITSPEFSLKKLISAGMGSIFQICKCFRNEEGLSERHNPEFTMIEWYHVNADYTDVMTDFEQLMLSIGEATNRLRVENGKTLFTYLNRTFDLTGPYPRITVAEAFSTYVGLEADDMLNRTAIVAEAGKRGYAVTADTTWEEAYNQLFLNLIEPELAKLDTPVFVTEYPASQAALSKRKASDPRFAERFEVYLGGLELGNAFSELTDAKEQEERIREDLQVRKDLGKVEYGMDEDFIEALQSGMPETGGIAVGVDRLVMLFANAPSIQDVLLFPAHEVFEV